MEDQRQADKAGKRAGDTGHQPEPEAEQHAGVPAQNATEDSQAGRATEQHPDVSVQGTTEHSPQSTDVTGLVVALLLGAIVTMPAVGVPVGLDATSIWTGVVAGLVSGVLVVMAVAVLVRVPLVRRGIVSVMKGVLQPLINSLVDSSAVSLLSGFFRLR